MATDRKPVLASLWSNILVFLMVPVVVDLVVFFFSLDRMDHATPGLPRTWIAVCLWTATFVGLAYARWCLVNTPRRSAAAHHITTAGVPLLALLCALFPLITGGFRTPRMAYHYSVVLAMVALVVAILAYRRCTKAGLAVGGIFLWLTFIAVVSGIDAHSLPRNASPSSSSYSD